MAETESKESKTEVPATPPVETTVAPTVVKTEFVALAKIKAKAVASAFQRYSAKRGGILNDIFELFPSLFSTDAPTRRMAVLFFVSLLGLVTVSGFATKRYWDARKTVLIQEAQLRAKKFKDLIRKEAEEAKLKASTFSLGGFTLELKDLAKQKLAPGQLNMAEVEVVILCDSAETRDYIEQNLVQVRNQLSNVFTAIERDELLSRDGKRRIKAVLIRKLNEWLPKGKVEDIYFSKLIVS